MISITAIFLLLAVMALCSRLLFATYQHHSEDTWELTLIIHREWRGVGYAENYDSEEKIEAIGVVAGFATLSICHQ